MSRNEQRYHELPTREPMRPRGRVRKVRKHERRA